MDSKLITHNMFGLTNADLVDLGAWVLGGVAAVYLMVNLRSGRPRSGVFLFAGMILSSLIGFGWCLLSLFVFPLLLGGEMSFSPDAEPLPFLADLSMRQAIPSGMLIAFIGTFLSWRLCSKNSVKRG